jgi:hypothetical protein
LPSASGPHLRLTDIGAPAPSRRAGARNPDHADARFEPIPIERCRELLSEEAGTLTDEEVALIRRHGLVRTAVTAPAFSHLRPIDGGNEGVVDQNIASWNRVLPWLRARSKC